jgi:hypothetical protein
MKYVKDPTLEICIEVVKQHEIDNRNGEQLPVYSNTPQGKKLYSEDIKSIGIADYKELPPYDAVKYEGKNMTLSSPSPPTYPLIDLSDGTSATESENSDYSYNRSFDGDDVIGHRLTNLGLPRQGNRIVDPKHANPKYANPGYVTYPHLEGIDKNEEVVDIKKNGISEFYFQADSVKPIKMLKCNMGGPDFLISVSSHHSCKYGERCRRECPSVYPGCGVNDLKKASEGGHAEKHWHITDKNWFDGNGNKVSTGEITFGRKDGRRIGGRRIGGRRIGGRNSGQGSQDSRNRQRSKARC